MATLYPIPSGEQMSGTPFYAEADEAVDGSEQELISFIVPIDTTRKLSQALVSCGWDGSFKVTRNGSVIGSGRTGPADRTVPIFWTPVRQIAPGDEIQLLFKGAQGVPIGMRVEAYIMASDF